MIALVAAWAVAGPVAPLDRLDVSSEDAPSWLMDELPVAGARPNVAAVRYLHQVQLVWNAGPVDVGTSVRSLSVQVERPIAWKLHGSGAVITRFGLPMGGRVGLALRHGPIRLGGSVVLTSSATWATPDWTTWRLLPGLGVGFGPVRDRRPKAPWM